MTEKIRNYLGIMLMVALVAVSYSIISYVDAYSRNANPSAYRSFSVSADSKVVGVPDVAQFSFGVITEGGKNLGNLQTQNSEKVNKAIKFLKDQGIDAKDITTQNYNVYPRYNYYDCRTGGTCPAPDITGYSINQSVMVKVRDFNKVGQLLSGVVDNGANSVSDLRFVIDDPSDLQNKARAEAIQKAQIKAKDIARAGGFHLGDLLSIDEGTPYQPQPYYAYGMGGAELKADAPAPVVEPGSQDIQVSVTLRYEIR